VPAAAIVRVRGGYKGAQLFPFICHQDFTMVCLEVGERKVATYGDRL
jgi:hypothetical protein